uniref:(northern house mosquito) hypothetical protein n=1 Tax=Culex pipiens TaxID=7175 RepID=A0A8D8FDV3_CULPI
MLRLRGRWCRLHRMDWCTGRGRLLLERRLNHHRWSWSAHGLVLRGLVDVGRRHTHWIHHLLLLRCLWGLHAQVDLLLHRWVAHHGGRTACWCWRLLLRLLDLWRVLLHCHRVEVTLGQCLLGHVNAVRRSRSVGRVRRHRVCKH